jgi:ApbE superfamily uncharacterized protein (UPF0280 family)
MKYKRAFKHKETSCNITADSEATIEAAISSIKHHRSQLERYIRTNPKFLHSLKPIHVEKGPTIVRLMAEAAERADVGPMAAVAGALADLAVEDMISTGAKIAVVENGGEVYAVSNNPINVALAAGDSPLSKRIGFRLEDFPIGVATSSGLYSHALSFGEAEAVTVFAVNAGVADAAATAVGNLVKGEDWRKAVECGIAKALSIEGVKGVLILYRGLVGKAGQIPKIVKVSNESKSSKSVL